MSVVTVQLGQCGNQVGLELFDVISNDAGEGGHRKTYSTASHERFFHQTTNGEFEARAVLIDMEPKVINHSMTKAVRSGKWRYGEKSISVKSRVLATTGPMGGGGAGRREVERCDRLAGLMPIMSVAGGTGSGVGTFVTQCLRDSFPKSFMLNHLTWPYGTGEVIVQNYNSVLTLSKLYRLSDAILVHENDTVHRICSQLLNIKHITSATRNPLGELFIYSLQHFRLARATKHLRQMLVSNTKMEEGIDWQVRPPSDYERTRGLPTHNFNRSLANLLIVRGKDVYSAETVVLKNLHFILPGCHPVKL
ncbi:hypothetical protein WMY93_029065 [Mugilogobius chulae]|uniref:Tubulin delta chain n=1 Tax=Mugilogobius chulae TaxID=88201 RepID=A0AAW0MUL0_9GOBI